MTDTLCPVCGKKVGSWHKSGVHPSCEKKRTEFKRSELGRVADLQQLAFERAALKPRRVAGRPDRIDPMGIAKMTQAQRDAILRRINVKG